MGAVHTCQSRVVLGGLQGGVVVGYLPFRVIWKLRCSFLAQRGFPTHGFGRVACGRNQHVWRACGIGGNFWRAHLLTSLADVCRVVTAVIIRHVVIAIGQIIAVCISNVGAAAPVRPPPKRRERVGQAVQVRLAAVVRDLPRSCLLVIPFFILASIFPPPRPILPSDPTTLLHPTL